MKSPIDAPRMTVRVFAACAAFALAAPAALADSASPLRISVIPERCVLQGPRGEQRIVVTGHYAGDEVRDLTQAATLTPAASEIVRSEGHILRPVGDGESEVTVSVGGQTTVVHVEVRDFGMPDPVSFKTETLAALTKAGCNMGACHGSPSGKGGFRLSLRGYDPPLDIMTLRSEFAGRRTNSAEPDESLILKKGLMQVAHGGSQRLFAGDPNHVALRNWIAEGQKLDAADEPDLERIEVLPRQRIFRDAGNRQQLIVNGYFSDGSVRDVTALTVFSSSAESVAKVDERGLVRKAGRGEAAILARYLDKMDNAAVTFLETVQGFAWNGSPEFNFIDRAVNAKLLQLQILPSDLCSDDEFLRRAYLDAIGRLPTIEEAQVFMNDLSDDKRERLVDRLLETPDYAAFWTMKWADVLRANTNRINAAGVHKFNGWIYEGVLTDAPMDQFARELLTASGSVYENPAANYWRSSRDPSDAVETTAQLFLGVRIQCAKCHNHPFERWTQDNYYGVGAAFARVGRKPGPTPNDEIIFPAAGGELTQPRTGATMKVHLLLTGDVDDEPGRDRREIFAEWLTKPENPFFGRSIVNRVWGHLLGRGIVDPVDDFRDSNPASNPQLLDELARQFAERGFSRKWLIRTIMNSHTYQRSARTNDFNKDDEIYFSHATTRMLSAEQLLDSICAVTDVPETFPGVPAGTRATQLPEPPADHYFLKIFGQPQREMACECERSSESNLSQALQMINGPTVHNKLRDDAGRINRMIEAGASDDEIITTLYLAGVSRTPTTQELETARTHVAASESRRFGLEDVGWALLNTKEFLFQH
ncbi:MAG: DUF1553 domain-containing protein [Planctomyces sp.]|nr:DUF1553 domain-containing protein [Planctomyces sp.]